MMISKAILIAIIAVSGAMGALATSLVVSRPSDVDCVPTMQDGTAFQPNVKSRRGGAVEF
ncbi:hypothetical protein [Sphingobium aromaticiconvertens]|uniref:hypothetical protein n=1 Tax=Sphingobium aromaticiconvertens TaxID=365341 RepID=UPI003017E8AB